jgi:drug/metabolite transporter (DMT)-like permease
VAAFVGAVISAAAYVTVRMIAKNVHFYVNVFYFGFMSTIFSSGLILFFEPNSPIFFHSWTFSSIVIQLAIGIFAFVAQSFLNKGLQLVPAGPGTLMRNLDIVFAFIFGVLIFGEKLTMLSVIGSSLIGGTTACAALYKFYKSSK